MTTEFEDRLIKVLEGHHVDNPIFFVLSDEGADARYEFLSQAKQDVGARTAIGDQGIQVWADYGDHEVAISQTTWKETGQVVKYTRWT
jgi:hypothetical protein